MTTWTPLLLQGVEVRRQGGDEGLAFAGDHLGDVAAVQDDAAEDLHVEVPHVLGAAAGLAAGGERLGQQVVERRRPWRAVRGTSASALAARRR